MTSDRSVDRAAPRHHPKADGFVFALDLARLERTDECRMRFERPSDDE